MKSYLKIIPYLICILFASCASDDSHPIQTPRQVNVALTVTLPEPENVQSLARSYTDSEIRNVDVLVFDEDGKFMGEGGWRGVDTQRDGNFFLDTFGCYFETTCYPSGA